MTPPLVIALHYQNDVLHADGKIRVGLAADEPARTALLEAAGRLLAGARARHWPIMHVRVAFRPDYADLLQNAPILRNVAAIGAVQEGSWGAAFFTELAPWDNPREFVVTHQRINGFYGTSLETLVRQFNPSRLLIAGVATHSVVESTVRHAVDCGFEVTVLADACASADSRVHAASLHSMALIASIQSVNQALEGYP
ncbi:MULTISPECIES: cysteine hydrolase family protein [unclassified Pseudomonas]|uniref:cysteine hydrolase family protein n=1 Tax=unclassified Pseudomonas TaxID=196821 RepID=UPI0015A364D0|nr:MULTISPECIES: isochorismatase family cysteine hydrolase [unclassified Pseudomonas]NWC93074.1 cysteine hydrolase [Pseudomonas sp. IPO3779]NWD19492.1 cysteine hydrolase [Pseudomonas sp. IPO3778]